MAEVRISVIEDDHQTTVVGEGILDFTNSLEFKDGLNKASETAESVVADLKLALFIDSAIVQYLANAAVTMIRLGKRLKVVVTDGGYPQQVLRIVGFDQLMDVVAE